MTPVTLTRDELAIKLRGLANLSGMDPCRDSALRLADDVADNHRLVLWSGVDLWRHFDIAVDDDDSSVLVRVLDGLRAPLVFLPIAVTWFGIWDASSAHDKLRDVDPAQAARPFLPLWQEGFDGLSITTLGQIALVDVALIALVVLLTFVRSFVNEIQRRTSLKRAAELHEVLAGVELELAPLALRSQDDVRHAFERALNSLIQLDDAAKILSGMGNQIVMMQQAAQAISNATVEVQRSTVQTSEGLNHLQTFIAAASAAGTTFMNSWTEKSDEVSTVMRSTVTQIESASKDLDSLAREVAGLVATVNSGGHSATEVLSTQAQLLREAAKSAQSSSADIVAMETNVRRLATALEASASALDSAGSTLVDELAQAVTGLDDLTRQQNAAVAQIERLANVTAVAIREIRADLSELNRNAAQSYGP